MRTGLGPTKTKKERKEGSGKTSKYDVRLNSIAEEACAIGASLNQLARVLGVTQPTVNYWMKDYPDFNVCVIRGRDRFAVEYVESALLKRAKGYSYTRNVDRVTKEGVVNCQEEMHVAPDVTAAIFFLINRNPHRWKSINRFQQMNVFPPDQPQPSTDGNGKELNAGEKQQQLTPDNVKEIIGALWESGAMDEQRSLPGSEATESTDTKIN